MRVTRALALADRGLGVADLRPPQLEILLGDGFELDQRLGAFQSALLDLEIALRLAQGRPFAEVLARQLAHLDVVVGDERLPARDAGAETHRDLLDDPASQGPDVRHVRLDGRHRAGDAERGRQRARLRARDLNPGILLRRRIDLDDSGGNSGFFAAAVVSGAAGARRGTSHMRPAPPTRPISESPGYQEPRAALVPTHGALRSRSIDDSITVGPAVRRPRSPVETG